MKAYDSKLARKMGKFKKLFNQLKIELEGSDTMLERSIKYIESIAPFTSQVGYFPEDTYNVVLAQKSPVSLGVISKNTKRKVIIDNRDKKICHDKKTGFLYNHADLVRNDLVVSIGLLFSIEEIEKGVENYSEKVKNILAEIKIILNEWDKFSEGYSYYLFEKGMSNIEKNAELIDSIWEKEFKTDIARKKGKEKLSEKQKEKNRMLYEKFKVMRPKMKTDKQVYEALAREELKKPIDEYKRSIDIISHRDGKVWEEKIDEDVENLGISIKQRIFNYKKANNIK